MLSAGRIPRHGVASLGCGDSPIAGPTLTVTSHAPARPGISYQPALDGLRGLALLAIAVYHSGVGWAPGAFLSVSTFFTLSGFLITSLLIREHEVTGGISLRDFWTRRLRRLMPAALATIALIVLAAIALGDSAQLSRLRGDGIASLTYVANWHFIVAGDSYAAIFSSPSPFTHFWTLAIEEQFYVLFPLVVAGLLAWGRGSRRVLAGAFAVLAVASIAWSSHLAGSGARIDRMYFGTDTRLAELLAGGLLALWWLGRPAPRGVARSRLRGVSSLALVAVVVLWLVADREAGYWYRGGLSLYALLTVLVMLGAVQRRGPVRSLLSVRPLVWVGKVSYAGYLVHWPILVWLQQHTGLAAPARLAIGLTASFIVAGLSQRFIERPIRTSSWTARTTGVFAGTGVAVVLALVVLVTAVVSTDGPAIDFEAAAARRAEVMEAVGKGAQTNAAAPRVATFGDSTAFMTGTGLADWGFDHLDQWTPAGGISGIGCGLLTNVTRMTKGESLDDPAECATWKADWVADAEQQHPDVSVLQLGPWEVVDQQLGRKGPYRTIGKDPELDQAIRTELRNAVDLLLVHSKLVVLLASPDIDVGRVDGRSPAEAFPESEPARMELFRTMLRDVAATDDRIVVLDLAGWLADHPDERSLRPDGVHFTNDTARTVAEWLGPQILSLYRT